MKRICLAKLIAVLTIAQSGCLTLYSKTEVVRGDEARRNVVFENPQAAEHFHAALKHLDEPLGQTYVGVPFITVFARKQLMSESATWNDAVARCDTNQDGVITHVEAAAFEKVVGG